MVLVVVVLLDEVDFASDFFGVSSDVFCVVSTVGFAFLLLLLLCGNGASVELTVIAAPAVVDDVVVVRVVVALLLLSLLLDFVDLIVVDDPIVEVVICGETSVSFDVEDDFDFDCLSCFAPYINQ